MRCCYCNKNEAVKSYERVENGVAQREYYCLACYEKQLQAEKAESVQSLSVCPYCGTSLAEFRLSTIVGCPYCYATMREGLMPAVVTMQGEECQHKGKKPLLSEEGEAALKKEPFLTDKERDALYFELVKAERFARQKKQLETLVAYLGGANPKREAEYKEKLERMTKTGEVEEEIVW